MTLRCFYSAGTVEIGDTVIPGGGLVGQVDLYSAASNAYATIHSNDAGSFSGLIVYTGAGFSAAPYIQFLTGGSAYTTFGPAGSAIFDANTSGSAGSAWVTAAPATGSTSTPRPRARTSCRSTRAPSR
jgi:hypothetical protein